ncbi:MAG: hypothetical protein Q9206_004814 [Seirophora lacunosa]
MANEDDRFQKGIDLEQVPPTFQHAIEVSGWFGVSWLWIDSFCIIQHSSADWEREALQMHKVYKQGFLNISADAAVDAQGGLFQSRHPTAVQPVVLELPESEETIYLTIDERNMFRWASEGPLSQRAWVFQERHLARRILHFTDKEIVWECCAKSPYFASETFPNGAPLTNVFDNKPKIQSGSLLSGPLESTDELYNLWENLCHMYSEKQLTKVSDKLVALAGLANEFHERIPDDSYVAGMWRSTMPRSLLWEAWRGPVGRKLEVAPSWSWASINGQIQKEYHPGEKKDHDTVCTVLDIQAQNTAGGSIGNYQNPRVDHPWLLQDV